MTSGYYCEIFPFCGGGKKKKKKRKDDKKTKAFYDWATTGIPVIMPSENKIKFLFILDDYFAFTANNIYFSHFFIVTEAVKRA